MRRRSNLKLLEYSCQLNPTSGVIQKADFIMTWGTRSHKFFAFFFVLIGISACVTSPTLHSIGDPLPSSDELAAVIDSEHAGSANDFLLTTFYRDPASWGGAAIWAYQMYSQEGRQDLLQVLQSRGWDVNTRSAESSYLPLRLAIESGSVPAVNALLAIGAEPDRLLGQCSRPCTFCPDFSRYMCSSALSLVVLAGKPAMLQPVLDASQTPAWREVDHATGATGDQITGDRALSVGINRAFQVGRGEAFASAFIEAGYAEQVTIARNAHQNSIAAAKSSSPAGGSDAEGGDELANAGMAAAIGLGLGALLGGDMDVGSAADMASTVMGSGSALGAGETGGDMGVMLGIAEAMMGSGGALGAGNSESGMMGMAESMMGSGGSSSAGSAEMQVMSFFMQTLAEAAAEGERLSAVQEAEQVQQAQAGATNAAAQTASPTSASAGEAQAPATAADAGGATAGGAAGGSAGDTDVGGSTQAASAGPQSFAIDEMYRPICPGGRPASREIPIKTNSQACAMAMRNFARVATCNLYQEQAAAQQTYYSACASEIYE